MKDLFTEARRQNEEPHDGAGPPAHERERQQAA